MKLRYFFVCINCFLEFVLCGVFLRVEFSLLASDFLRCCFHAAANYYYLELCKYYLVSIQMNQFFDYVFFGKKIKKKQKYFFTASR